MTKLNKKSVFEYLDYKLYLSNWIADRPNAGRGERSRIAEHLHCQLAYISQVLAGSAHFSFEQGEALNHLLSHTDDEAEFFLLLIHLERSGTSELKKRIKKKIKEILDRRLILKNRLTFEKSLNREDQMFYYSAWHYAAIHMAIAIPELRSREKLAQTFQLSLATVTKTLDFLTSRGLIDEKKGVYSIGDSRIHLENDSPMISKHHTNWRMQAIQSLTKEKEQDLHYSSVITISESDVPKVRETLVKAIESVREIIRPSQDEKVFCYCIDLFEV
jgi:uncharacterized protein (TIGR02147 family)